jgi:hypothetical protein
MKQMDSTPLWVRLAWDAIPTRKMAMGMIIVGILFTLYCIPWVKFSAHPLVAKFFLIDDWWWSGPMFPLIIWYWLSLKWVDNNNGWEA